VQEFLLRRYDKLNFIIGEYDQSLLVSAELIACCFYVCHVMLFGAGIVQTQNSAQTSEIEQRCSGIVSTLRRNIPMPLHADRPNTNIGFSPANSTE
jgi:hypothetical protein